MYKIGALCIQIDNVCNSQLIDRLAIFHHAGDSADIRYSISYLPELSLPPAGDIVYRSSNLVITRNNHTTQYYHVHQGTPYAMVEEQSPDRREIFLLTEVLGRQVHPYFVPELMQLERGLIHKNSFVFHCSYIEVEGGAILFSAPSGGGKSTQADLWKQYGNAEIINGDKGIIAREQDGWMVHGIPFSGSSEYCLNKTLPLKAIVILDKGPVNRLYPVGLRGFANVFSQVTVNPWDPDFCSKAMDLVMDVCNEIPVYFYSCTKTKEAVDVLSQELREKGIIHGMV